MFVIKYDKISMIKLCRSIEKYPAIYDTKKHYSKEAVEKAWDSVALEVGEKDSLCRERWHSIKSCYMRHLKFTALNSKRKPYYLAEYLHFMLPFASEKIRKFFEERKRQLNEYLPNYLKEALPQAQPLDDFYQQVTSNEITEVKSEILEVENDNGTEWLTVSLDYPQPSSSKPIEKRVNPNREGGSSKRQKTRYINHKQDENVNFFKSLLPEIARMSSHQKLKFKQETLSIIEDILYASEEITLTE